MMQDDEKLGLYDKPKQTAVEWLVEQLFAGNEIFGCSKELLEQAKEMEKKQIIDAYKVAEDKWELFQYEHRYGREYLTAEPYYTETYEK